MLVVFYLFLVLACLKLIINTSKFLQCRKYLEMYFSHLAVPGWEISEHSQQIVKLLEDAGVEDSYVGYAQPVGYRQIMTGQASVFANFANRRQDIASSAVNMLHKAKGTYRARALETFSPLYWIEFIIYLPRKIFGYLGASPDNVLIRIANLLYWVAVTIGGILYGIFRPDLEVLIRTWIDTLIQ